ncbi:MAG: leucine-rich repeat domain-containing protein, partial [Mycoplasmataceae bacterium]|nr:leucine-rich repeat domain-containing protein [Mycoplasmataceae bacterium]
MESKNQTESLKFRKEDGEPSNPDNNVLNSEQHRIWKHHGKVKIALIAGAGIVGVGGGIGIGYAIPHTGPQIPKSLHITGVPPNPIEGAPNFAITPITLACETDTKVTIADAQYSASNLPAGLKIDSSNGQCTISGTPTAQTTDPCTIYTTSAATGLFSTATINFNIALNTLVISPTTLASDTALAKACNLKIEDGVLSRFNDWTTTGVNTKFNNYLADLGDFKTTAIQFEGVGSISERAFEGCGALGNGGGIEKIRIVDSPSGLGSSFIGGSAFKGCAGLTSVDLSGLVNLKVIDNGAFLNCASLTAINFPSSLEVIGNGAFSGCTALSSIALPESLKSIDNVAFAGCEALTTVDLSKTAVTAIG